MAAVPHKFTSSDRIILAGLALGLSFNQLAPIIDWTPVRLERRTTKLMEIFGMPTVVHLVFHLMGAAQFDMFSVVDTGDNTARSLFRDLSNPAYEVRARLTAAPLPKALRDRLVNSVLKPNFNVDWSRGTLAPEAQATLEHVGLAQGTVSDPALLIMAVSAHLGHIMMDDLPKPPAKPVTHTGLLNQEQVTVIAPAGRTVELKIDGELVVLVATPAI